MIGRLLCRFFLHRYVFKTFVREYLVDDVTWIELTTKCRCRRRSCKLHDWWSVVDVEHRCVGKVPVS